GILHRERLRQLGIPGHKGDHLVVGPWLLSPAFATAVGDRLPALVEEHARAHPLDPAVPLAVLASRLRLPSPDLVRALVRPPMRVVEGRVVGPEAAALPNRIRDAVEVVRRELGAAPFVAPTADRLRELGLDDRALGAAHRSGQLWRVGPGIVLLPDALDVAITRLRELEQPFTTSAARKRLETSRRVVLPLLDQLDRAGRTRRLADDRRQVTR
ncbi:SelB domain-containing protein, partial [Rhodococcus chondri]